MSDPVNRHPPDSPDGSASMAPAEQPEGRTSRRRAPADCVHRRLGTGRARWCRYDPRRSAAYDQRAHSASCRASMPTVAVPRSTSLDGLTTAFIVDQERWAPIAARRRAPRPTPPRCCGCSSADGQRCRSSNASPQRAVRSSGLVRSRSQGAPASGAHVTGDGGCVRREAWDRSDIDLTRSIRQQSITGRADGPGYTNRRLDAASPRRRIAPDNRSVIQQEELIPSDSEPPS